MVGYGRFTGVRIAWLCQVDSMLPLLSKVIAINLAAAERAQLKSLPDPPSFRESENLVYFILLKTICLINL